MKRLFSKLTDGRVFGSRSSFREARATARLSVSFPDELRDAMDAAHVSAREPDEDGPRVMVLSPSLRGAFIFSRDEAERRIRLAFPDVAAADVKRAVLHLENRARNILTPIERRERSRGSWVHGWGWTEER